MNYSSGLDKLSNFFKNPHALYMSQCCNSSTWLQTTANYNYRARLRNNILARSITLYASPTTRWAWQLTGTLAPLTLFNKETSWRYDRHKVRVVSAGGGGGLEQVVIVQVSSKHVSLSPFLRAQLMLSWCWWPRVRQNRRLMSRQIFICSLCCAATFISVYPA